MGKTPILKFFYGYFAAPLLVLMDETIILPPPGSITEYFIGLVDLLEFFFRFPGVLRVMIGMIERSHSPKRFLDFLLAGGLINPEQLVVVFQFFDLSS